MTERQDIIEKLQRDIIPRWQVLKDRGAYFDLLTNPSWEKIEAAWIEDFEYVGFLLQIIEGELTTKFDKAGKMVDQSFENLDTLKKYGPLADIIPENLLLSRTEHPPRITRPGVAWALSRLKKDGIGNDGDLTIFEALKTPGTGKIIKTGFQGDNRGCDQAAIAYSLIRSIIDIRTCDIHLHKEENSQGGSAGLTIMICLISALQQKRVCEFGFTGALTLSGDIKPVSGILCKLIGAYQNGLSTVVLPRGNESELETMPKVLRETINIKLVSNIEEALMIAMA